MASTNPNRREAGEHEAARDRLVVTLRSAASWTLRLAAFWASVLLPFVALAVLVTGVDSPAEWRLFAGLLAANVVALYLGHPYENG